MDSSRRAPFCLTVLDADGIDIGPPVEVAAEAHGVPVRAIVACLRSESGVSATAERWGDRTADAVAHLDDEQYLADLITDLGTRGLDLDISFGMSQLIVKTAGGYGIGDGSSRVGNVLRVRELLFDRSTSIDLCARHLASCFASARDAAPGVEGDDLTLLALRCYNGGGYGLTDDYTRHYAANLASYERALSWAARLAG